MILQGDTLEMLKTLDSESIDCVVTSPPYFALREYEAGPEQYGLEPTFFGYLEKLYRVMDELKRVVNDTGTVWVNLGDSYNCTKSNNTNGLGGSVKQKAGINRMKINKRVDHSLRKKSLFGVPERFYVHCIDDGWIARNHIIWYKRNHMPSSAEDRFTNAYESVFFFTKNIKYQFDLDPVREKPLTRPPKNPKRKGRKPNNKSLGNRNFMPIHEKYAGEPQSNVARLHKDREGNPNKQDNVLGADGKVKATYAGFNERWRNKPLNRHEANQLKLDGTNSTPPKDKNPGDVWDIPTKPYKEAHFATFPPELPRRIIECSTKLGDTVLDPFAGSGTTLIEACRLQRKYIGIELSESYCQMIRKRLQEMI